MELPTVTLPGSLPVELVWYIMSYLKTRDLLRLCFCSTDLWRLVTWNSEHFWFLRLEEEFPLWGGRNMLSLSHPKITTMKTCSFSRNTMETYKHLQPLVGDERAKPLIDDWVQVQTCLDPSHWAQAGVPEPFRCYPGPTFHREFSHYSNYYYQYMSHVEQEIEKAAEADRKLAGRLKLLRFNTGWSRRKHPTIHRHHQPHQGPRLRALRYLERLESSRREWGRKQKDAASRDRRRGD